MLRAYHPFDVPDGATTLMLSKDESFHLAKVLRARTGEAVEAFDGKGKIFSGKILGGDAKALEISVESSRQIPPPRCRLALAQAMPKGSLMDDVVRQATEIGAAKIFPLASARSEVKLDAKRAEHKLERWRAIAVEACKQCGNAFVPEIFPVMTPDVFFKTQERGNALWITASLEAGTRPCTEIARECAGNPPEEILWLVGPEGDFSPEEYALARESGCIPARLGDNVLRAVTAAIYTLAAGDQMRQSWELKGEIRKELSRVCSKETE